ncbi:MAG: peptidoglycan DD-metalloendopeptidase family protein [Clostridia bacterium]|nr:peptidoglycan DD-metalloendopeptidase family protein [Clostridia bacterium]
MNNKRYGRRVLSAVLCVLLFFSMVMLPPVQSEAASLEELQANLSNLKEQQAALDNKLAELKNQASSQQAYLDQLNQKISNAQSQINNLNAQIEMYDVQIVQKEKEISEAEDQINADYEVLKKRLKVLYMMGEASMLDIVLSAESVTDYFNKAEFVSAIVKHDNEIIEQMKDRTNEIREEMKAIEADRAAVALIRTEYDLQKMELNIAASEAKRVAAVLAQQAADAEAQKIELQKKYDEADKAIEQWWIEYNKQQQQLQQQNQIVGTGTFIWPMPGYASKKNLGDMFGAGRGHRGIDINGANIYGKTFIAADSGRVAYVSYNDSIYGIYCIIDHGKGITTLYGHCSGLLVKKGQTVTKGQKIGYVGESGIATGPHLHFGVLKNGVAIDPMKYFNIGG